MKLDVQTWPEIYGADAQPRKGFFTDTSLCIGCKACEVACKEWNHVPADQKGFSGKSYDNSLALGADRWRHVAFIEQKLPISYDDATTLVEVAQRGEAIENGVPVSAQEGMRWLMSSDVCKHCTHAACLEVCPTGALFRTEFGTVVVQQDVCNGCGYCIPACPFGVIERREDDGRAFKCTLCYDRVKADKTPACAQACPTQSIQFGDLEELRDRAQERVSTLQARGETGARLYLEDSTDGVGGAGAFFLLLDEPEVYGLPPDPVDPVRSVGETWRASVVAAAGLAVAIAGAVLGGRR